MQQSPLRTTNLTSQHYWEKYYNSSQIHRDQIIRLGSVYDPIWQTFIESASPFPQTILEIGAYPGRYLAYLASKFGLRPTAIDFNSDRTKIQQAMQEMGVEDYEIIQDDFLTATLDQQFDLVYSMGFIEHFENFNEVMDKHVQLVKPGGALLIMVPNKRFLRKWYGYLCDYENLKVHNLKCMSKTVFRRFAQRNGLVVKHLEYWGGFPYSVHQELNLFQKVIYKVMRGVFRRINPIISRLPNRYLSEKLIGVFKKP